MRAKSRRDLAQHIEERYAHAWIERKILHWRIAANHRCNRRQPYGNEDDIGVRARMK